jgi:hypothetical protein
VSVRIISLLLGGLVLACGPSLALASGPPKDGHYSGEIGPGYPINFSVSANGTVISGLVVGFEETCNGAGPTTAPLFHFNTLQIKMGKFSGSSTDHFGKKASDALRISGAFSDGKATGKLTDTSKITSLPTCTESEPFTAKTK